MCILRTPPRPAAWASVTHTARLMWLSRRERYSIDVVGIALGWGEKAGEWWRGRMEWMEWMKWIEWREWREWIE